VPKDVRHVPVICLNFISSKKVNDNNLINPFGDGKLKLTSGSEIVARGSKEGSLYVMQGKLHDREINIAHDNS